MTRGYAELHCHSNFSFLDGASHPEELAAEAARLGLEALALTDHDGLYGVVRFAEAARRSGCPRSSVRSSPSAAGPPEPACADPAGAHLVVLARDPEGYARLRRASPRPTRRRGEGKPEFDLDSSASPRGHWRCSPGAARVRCPRPWSTRARPRPPGQLDG